MNRVPKTVFSEFAPHLIDVWKRMLADSPQMNDLGVRPEWCRNWAKSYNSAWSQVSTIQCPDAIYPLMIRRVTGLRVLSWLGQSGGMTSDYSGGTGSYSGLLEALIEWDGWDVADLQIAHWQRESATLIKALYRYEKYLWRIEAAEPSIIIDLPPTFDEWVAGLGRTPRRQVRQFVKASDEGTVRFELLQGEEMVGALDDLIANNATTWDVFSEAKYIDFMKKTVGELAGDSQLFLARLADDDAVWACCLGYCSEASVFIHTAGIRRERVHGLAPGITLYSLLIREMIEQGMRTVDFCPGMEEYKLRLGGHWVPNHRVVFARTRSAHSMYRAICAVVAFFCICRDLAKRYFPRQS